MIKVPSYIEVSNIHGKGLFAARNIRADAVVWEFDSSVDFAYSTNYFTEKVSDALSKVGLNVDMHVDLVKIINDGEAKYVLRGDNGRFLNHSRRPNLVWDKESKTLKTARFIDKDEELTTDYRQWSEGPEQIFY